MNGALAKPRWITSITCLVVDGARLLALGSPFMIGSFGGSPKGWAKLRYTLERARWVTGERWHSSQRRETLADWSYVLEIPYSDERELVGDLLRFGADVEVLEPAELGAKVKRALHKAAGRYV